MVKREHGMDDDGGCRREKYRVHQHRIEADKQQRQPMMRGPTRHRSIHMRRVSPSYHPAPAPSAGVVLDAPGKIVSVRLPHSPLNSALRFSAKACVPSFTSFEPRSMALVAASQRNPVARSMSRERMASSFAA